MKRFTALALCLAFLFSLPALATISVTTARIVYTGSGSTGPFPVPFHFTDDSELTVTKISSTSLATVSVLTLDVDYTVTGAGTTSGYVTLISTLSSSYKLVIQRGSDYLQSTDYEEGEAFTAATHEAALDKHTRELQEIKDASDRSLKLLPGTTDTTINVHLANPAASKAICWDSTGKALTNCSTTTISVASLDMVANYSDFAAMIAAIGSTPTTMLVTEATAPDENSTVPCTLKLFFVNGAALNPASGVKITLCSPNNIIAQPDQEIFGGNGTIVFQQPGTVYADWWGPAKDGTTDDYADLNATITSVPAKSTVVFGNGTYRVSKEFYITKGITIGGVCSGEGTVIKSLAAPANTLITWKPANPDIEHTGIKCITLDGNNTTNYGLWVRQSNLGVFEDIVAQNFVLDGVHLEAYEIDDVDENLHSVSLNRCSFKLNANGIHYKRGSSDMGNNLTVNDSHCYYNTHACAWAHGDNSTLNYNMEPIGTTLTWNGGSVEGRALTADDFGFLATAGSTIHVNDPYIEMYDGGWDYYSIQKSTVYVRGGSSTMLEASMTEDNSTICLEESTATTTGGISYNVGNRKLRRCVGDLISDNLKYGSPEYPTPRYGGYKAWKGDRWINAYGTEYVQVADGTEQALCNDNGTYCTYPYSAGHYVASGNNRWTPQNRIVIPISAADLNAQTKDIFWAEGDYLLYNVQFVVVRPFVTTNTSGCTNDGGDVEAFFNIGTDSSRDQFISAAQASASKLIENATISAWDNNDTEAVLYHQEKSHPSWWMPGRTAYSRTIYVADNGTVQSGASVWPYWKRSYIKLYACPYTGGSADGTWTDGFGYIVITGDSLEYNNSDTR